MEREKVSGADAVLQVFDSYGIEQIFCSPGSEWPPIWEALAKKRDRGMEKPYYLNCRHEELAVSAAIAYGRITGKVPAVLLHTTLGLLKGSMAIRAAFKIQTPMVILSGGTIDFGDGDYPLGAQFLNLADVGGPRRFAEPFVKWSSDAVSAVSLVGILNHACEIAMAPPKGPTFVYVPFEILFQQVNVGVPTKKKNIQFDYGSKPELVRQASQLLLESRSPIIVTEYAGENPRAVRALVELAETLSIPVIETGPRSMNFPRDHPLHLGFEAKGAVKSADLVLLVGTNNPWYPPSDGPSANANIILIDHDPGKSRSPFWNFGVDFAITGSIELALCELTDEVKKSSSFTALSSTIKERLANTKKVHDQNWAKSEIAALEVSKAKPIQANWASYVLGKVLPKDSIVVLEVTSHNGAINRLLTRTEPGTVFSPGGGLGMGFGFSIGAKLSAKDKLVVGLIGDGAFNYNPVLACFGFIQEYNVPILLVILNNHGYSSMHNGILRNFPEGYAVKTKIFYGGSITPPPDYAGLAVALGGYGEKVDDPSEFEPALKRAIEKVRGGQMALLDVVMAFEDPYVLRRS